MNPATKYTTLGIAGGSLISQAAELVKWVAQLALPASAPALPNEAAIFIAGAIVIPALGLLWPASSRPQNGDVARSDAR